MNEETIIHQKRQLIHWLSNRPVSMERVLEQLSLSQSIGDDATIVSLLRDLERTEALIGTQDWFYYWKCSQEVSRVGQIYIEEYESYGIRIPKLKTALKALNQLYSGTPKEEFIITPIEDHLLGKTDLLWV